MTDKQHPEALRLADELDAVPETGADPQTIQDAAAELRRQHAESEMRRTALLDEMQKAARQHAENETLRAKIKAYEDLDEAASDVQLLRMGYAAARLEIESLQARIKTMAEEHADELMVAHLDGMRAAQQEAQEPVAWYVTGCSRLLDEAEAKAEARHIGGTARAMPLYTAPQPSPKADSQPAPANTRQIAECYGDCPTDPKTCANQCKFEGRAPHAPADSVTAPAGEGVAGPSDKMVLAAARVLSPALFRYGLEPLRGDGANIAAQMWREAAQVRRMLDAALAAAAPPAQAVPVRGAPADLPPLPDPDLRDVGTNPEDIKNFLRGYATEYAKVALAAHKQGANHD